MAEFRQWFIDLWNHSIIPYLQEGAKDGIKVNMHTFPKYNSSGTNNNPLYNNTVFTMDLPSCQVHGHKSVWEDPVEWVRGTLPWPNAQQDQSRLFHLPPPSIGPLSEEKKPPKDTPPPSTLESDPLVSDCVDAMPVSLFCKLLPYVF